MSKEFDEFMDNVKAIQQDPEVEINRDWGYPSIIIPKEESKQIKCYCGHTTYCDCGPLEEPKQETLEEAAEIDLTNLCYYDKRNPECSVDDEDIEDHKKSLLKKNKTCSCDNCFYGRSKLTEQLIWQAERMYSEEEVLGFGKFCVDKIADFLDGKGDQTDGQEYSMEELFEQFKKK